MPKRKQFNFKKDSSADARDVIVGPAGASADVAVAAVPAASADGGYVPVADGLSRRQQIRKHLFADVLATVAPEPVHLVTESAIQAMLVSTYCVDVSCSGETKAEFTRNGFDSTIVVICRKCLAKQPVQSPGSVTSLVNGQVKPTIVPRTLKFVYESLLNNLGLRGYNRVACSLSTPAMSCSKYERYAQFLYQNMRKEYVSLMTDVANRVKRHYIDEEGAVADPVTGLVDISVSFDGTWQNRGHRSHTGIGIAMDSVTGTVLDLEVLSNFCLSCASQKTNLTEAAFSDWKATHTNCKQNFDGNSGSMEAAAAARIWGRSAELGFRYTSLISDGDAAAFKAVCALNDGAGPYDIPVQKEECVNHVSKRLGTRLRKLKKDAVVNVTTKTGKVIRRSTLGGPNLLTDAVIDNLARHYGQNVRKNVNGSVIAMRKAILSTYLHAGSTDEAPNHGYCPEGVNSWCFYRKSESMGEAPDSHRDMNLYFASIPAETRRLIYKIYADLTTDELLTRCIRGLTQNTNESLHSKIWLKCSKAKFAGLSRVTFAAQATALSHNFGIVRSSLLLRMGLGDETMAIALADQEKASERPPGRKRPRRGSAEQASPEYGPGLF